MDIADIVDLVKDGLILHHSGGSSCFMKDNTNSQFSTKVDVLQNINVLGCGDMFVSFFIDNFLKTNDFKNSIRNSHKLVTEYLKRTN